MNMTELLLLAGQLRLTITRQPSQSCTSHCGSVELRQCSGDQQRLRCLRMRQRRSEGFATLEDRDNLLRDELGCDCRDQ